LQQAGHAVRATTSSEEAARILEAEEPALAVLDVCPR